MLLEFSIPLAILSEFSFTSVTFSKRYARKQKWVFFLNTVYIILPWMPVK